MKRPRGVHHARLAAVTALAAAFLGSGSTSRAGSPPQTASTAVATNNPASADAEHDVDRSPAIRIKWLLPVGSPVRVFGRSVRLELLGTGLATPHDLEVRTIEDAGSQQTRRVGQPLRDTLVAPFRLEIPITFAATSLTAMTHSGMFVAVVKACATGSRCLTGTSEPLFFHPDGGGYLVYDEAGLCRFFRCGALTGGDTAERGTWRVMGGGPLPAAPSREEPGQESPNPVVDGGDV